MIKEAYCSFEVAELLKEKGFNEPCYTCYINKELSHYDYLSTNFELIDNVISAPTHQMAMKWLRVQGVYSSLVPFIENVGWPKDTWHINFYNSDGIIGGGFPVKGYEEAVEAALKYSLENLI